MRRFVQLVMMAALVAAIWFFFQNYEIEGLDQVTVRRKTPTPSAVPHWPVVPATVVTG